MSLFPQNCRSFTEICVHIFINNSAHQWYCTNELFCEYCMLQHSRVEYTQQLGYACQPSPRNTVKC